MNTRKNSIRNWLRKCGILTLTAGMILTGMITKPVETYAVTFVQDTDGTKYAVDKKSGFYYALSKSATKKAVAVSICMEVRKRMSLFRPNATTILSPL